MGLLSPLAEGRELKSKNAAQTGKELMSPLAEGRELKYVSKEYVDEQDAVAPRGGA